MLSEKNEYYTNIDMLCNLNEISEEILIFKMIYKPNYNKDEKYGKSEKFEKENISLKEEIRILGGYFVKNNKNKVKLIYKNKKYEVKPFFSDIDKNYKYKDNIKLKLVGINNIFDMGGMFFECSHLLSVKEYNKEIDIKNMNNLSNLSDFFYEDNSNFSLLEGTQLNCLNNEEIINPDLYIGCKEFSLSLSSIKRNLTKFFCKTDEKDYYSKSNIRKNIIYDMYCMFDGFNSLISLPDISKWDTFNVKDMSSIFAFFFMVIY